MSVRCERTSEQTSEWPGTICVDFIVILPIVRPKRVSWAAMTTASETRAHTHTQTRGPQHGGPRDVCTGPLARPLAGSLTPLSCSLACSLTRSQARGTVSILMSQHQAVLNHSAQWVETAWNRRIQFMDKNLFPMSSGTREWASERTNERSGARERSGQCGTSELACGASEQESERVNGPVLYATS